MTPRERSHEILRAVPASFRETRVALALGVGGLALFLVLLVALSVALDRHTLYFFSDVPGGRGFGEGLSTAISSFALVVAAAALFLRRRLSVGSGDEADSGWLTLAAVGAGWLAVDELMMMHERLTTVMARVGIPKLFGVLDQDVLIFIAYGVLAVLIGWRLMPLLHRHRRVGAPLVLAAVLFGATQVVDVYPWDAMSAAEKAVFGPLEEILKTLGSASLAIWGLLIVERSRLSPHV